MASLISQSVCLVTGGASGLGSAVVKRLLANGARGVVCLDLQQAPAQKNLESFKGDVASEKDVLGALDLAEQKFGHCPRIVVNAAGIAPTIRIISGKGVVHPLDAFEKTLRVNVVGSFNVMRLASDRMVKKAEPLGKDKQRGVVINTASVAAFDGQIGQIAYSASKGGARPRRVPADPWRVRADAQPLPACAFPRRATSRSTASVS
jgi:3-hydroxyacyl-CoA dehydrogenase/3-hydroxy-2-methylbutyryl-CoA dehydrogenase